LAAIVPSARALPAPRYTSPERASLGRPVEGRAANGKGYGFVYRCRRGRQYFTVGNVGRLHRGRQPSLILGLLTHRMSFGWQAS
jgi:hypothetical protein